MPLSLLRSSALVMSFTGDRVGGSVISVLVEYTVAPSSWTGELVFISAKCCLGGMLIVRIAARN